MIDSNITTCCALSLKNCSRHAVLHLIHGNKLLTRTEIESFYIAGMKKANWKHDLFLAQYFVYSTRAHFKMFIAAKTSRERLTNFMLLQALN